MVWLILIYKNDVTLPNNFSLVLNINLTLTLVTPRCLQNLGEGI